MSITRDLRSYADAALEQGKHVVARAQNHFEDASGQANQVVGKFAGTANKTVADLRAHAKGYGSSVAERAEGLFAAAQQDERVAKLVGAAEVITGLVVETVHARVVKPVQSLTGRGVAAVRPPRASRPTTTKPAARAAQPASGAKAATTRPANKPAAKPAKSVKTSAAKASAAKTGAAKTTAAKTSAARTTAAKTTAAKTTATKTTAAKTTAAKTGAGNPAKSD
jgi:hypothetical protein